jgi:YVTN family beta-propeller protein
MDKENTMRNRLLFTTLILLFLTMLLLAGRATTFAASDSGTIPPPPPIACTWESQGPVRAGYSLYVNSIDASSSYASDLTLYAATTEDLQRSSDGGKSWHVLFTRPESAADDAYFSHVRAAPAANANASPTTLMALLFTPGPDSSTVYRSTNAGATWQPVSTLAGAGLPRALAISPNYAADQTVFAIFGQGLALHKSVNGGQSWQTYAFGPISDFFNGFGLAVSPAYATDQTIFAAGFGPLHRSTNAGVNWTALGGSLSPTYAVAVSPHFATDRRVWLTYRTIEGVGDGTPEAGVQRSTNGGGGWTLGEVGLPGAYEPHPRFLSVSPRFAADQSLFTALKGDVSLGTVETVFRSFDGGAVWADQFMPPNSPSVNDTVTTFTPAEGVRIHLATAQGVWSYARLCEQRLINPGFETDWRWVLAGQPTYAAYTSESVYSGRRSLRLGITGTTTNTQVTATAQQTLTLPADVTGITLALWLLPQTTEPPLAREGMAPLPGGDMQYVRLYTSGNRDPITLWQDRATSPSWLQRTFDLTPYAGQTVRIELGVDNDGVNGVTALFADNTTVNVGRRGPTFTHMPIIFRQEAAPGPTATPTSTTTPTATPGAATATPTVTPTASPTSTALPRLVATVNLGARARGVAVSADGLRGYVGLTNDDGRGEIGVLTLQPLTLTQRITLGPASSSLNDVALNQEGRLLFAAEREAGTLAVVNVISGTVSHRLAVGALPNGVAVHRGSGYVANFGGNSVTFFNPATGAFSATLPNVGSEPSLFAVKTTGAEVFMSLHGADQVITFAGATPVGARAGLDDAYGLAYDPAGRLYVANRGPAHKVSVIDVATNQVIGSIDTADKEPYVVAVNPDTGHLFVVCDSQVRVYRTADLGLVKTIALAAGYNSRIALDTVLDRVYVTDFDSRTLSVIQDGG